MEIGEYVRTKEGIIDKIFKYDEILEEYWCVNKIVIDINNKIGTPLIKHISNKNQLSVEKYFIDNIHCKLLSIVTKEQFKSVEYKIEEEK